MPFQKYQSPARKGSNVTHYVIIRKRVEDGEKNEARSFPITSEKSTEEIRDEIRSLITANGR